MSKEAFSEQGKSYHHTSKEWEQVARLLIQLKDHNLRYS